MKLIKINALISIKILLLSLILFSCSKEDKEDQSVYLSDISNIVLDLYNLGTTKVNTNINYQFSGPNTTEVLKKVSYKLKGDDNYTEANEGIITGLKPGKKYLIKAIIEIGGKQKTSEEMTFTTLGFESTLLVGRVLDYENRVYSISNQSVSFNYTEAPELRGYLKVGQDSLELEKIEPFNFGAFKITLPKNTQHFFENDSEHVIRKEFSIGLFSGDYYIEVTESVLENNSKFIIKNDKHFTIYNKTPFIDRVLLHKPFLQEYTCEGIPKIKFSIHGGFGKQRGSLLSETQNILYEQISISFKRNESTNSEQLSILDYDSLASVSQNGIDWLCNSEQYNSNGTLFDPTASMEHLVNSIQFSLNRDVYQTGNYQIQFSGVDINGEIWHSNTFDFFLE